MATMSDWAVMLLGETARSLVGSHYLWGAAGAAPNERNGASYRAGSVGLAAFDVAAARPSIHAATCSVDGLHVCGGNYANFGYPPIAQGDPSLGEYLSAQRDAKRRGMPVEADPSDGTTPRQVSGYTVTSTYVWGEDCRGVRHFDCIGFVNYCLTVVANRDRLASGFSGDIAWHKQYSQSIGLNMPAMAGDILTKRGNGHIALMLDGGKVAQASDTTVGVIISSYAGSSWEYRGRHDGSLFY